jgi:hypothetical protein
MAIKGKSKSKTAKAVTRGPKPTYVPVKKPLLARRGLWMGVASVLGVLLIAGLWYGFAKEAEQNRAQELDEARAVAVEEFGNAIDPILGTIGAPVPPASWSSFTELAKALDRLESGEGQPAVVAETASGVAGTANTAWQAMNEIDEVAIVRGQGLDETFVLLVLHSNDTLVQSLKLYEQAGELAAMAAQAPEGAERDALVERARGTMGVAQALFDDGYGYYVEAQALAGVFEPTSLPGNLPFPTGPTG